jgi:hypothetical protein
MNALRPIAAVAGLATIACGCAAVVPASASPGGVGPLVEAHRELVGDGSASFRLSGLAVGQERCEAPAAGPPRFHTTAEGSRLALAASAE